MTKTRIFLALAASLLATPLLAQGAKPAAPSPAAAYLAGNCTSCHGTDGNAVSGMNKLVGELGGKVCGVGVAIEKGFQQGGKMLRAMGINLKSLAIVTGIKDGEIQLADG